MDELFLLVPVLSQLFLAFVRSDLVSFSLFTTRHRFRSPFSSGISSIYDSPESKKFKQPSGATGCIDGSR